MANEEMPAYIARKKCGCIVFAAVDDPDNKELREDNAREIAKLILAGLAIERVTVGFARKSEFGCWCGESQRGLPGAAKN